MVNTGNRLVNFWQKFGKQWELESVLKIKTTVHDLHGRIQIRSIPVHAVHVSVEAAGETCQRYEYWLAEDFGVMAIPTQQT